MPVISWRVAIWFGAADFFHDQPEAQIEKNFGIRCEAEVDIPNLLQQPTFIKLSNLLLSAKLLVAILLGNSHGEAKIMAQGLSDWRLKPAGSQVDVVAVAGPADV